MAEEKDMHNEAEDVEGHVNQGMQYEPDAAVNAAHDDDEGDDVEGHVNQGMQYEPDAAVNAAHDDEGDDVEGHVNLN